MRSRSGFNRNRIRNRLLGALPAAGREVLLPELQPIVLSVGDTLSAAGEAITHAYFIEEGIVSLVQPLSDGAAIEVAVIGREGFVGFPLLLGSEIAASDAKVEFKGTALKVAAKALLEAAHGSSELKSLLLRFAYAVHVQVAQTAACNGRHNVRQRLARWLLAARDRSDTDELAVSHEMLSTSLGLRRAGVTVALGEMKSLGLISNTHGCIRIADGEGLAAVACECYRLVRDEYSRSLP